MALESLNESGRHDLLAQLRHGFIAQLRRLTAECNEAQDTARARDLTDLLWITKTGKEVATEECFGRVLHAARAQFSAHADACSEGLDLIAEREIEPGDVFAPAGSTETKPAEADASNNG